MTRAAVWKQKEQEAEGKQLVEEYDIVLTPLIKEEQRTEAKGDICDIVEEHKSEKTDLMVKIDDELFWKAQEKRRLSRNMKRADKKQHNRSGGSGDNHI